MRAMLILAGAVLLAGIGLADDKGDRERRVRVALALSKPAEPEVRRSACGNCRLDVAAARKEGAASGKPVVLIVGKCNGLGAAAEKGGAIPVQVDAYSGDDRGGEPRVVVLEPKADRVGFTIDATLPINAEVSTVEAAVRDATPPRPKKLDWGL